MRVRYGTCQRWVYQLRHTTLCERLTRSSKLYGVLLVGIYRPSTQQHVRLLVVPRTIGVSIRRSRKYFQGVRTSRWKGRDDMADRDKDQPGVWDVRRHHVPEDVHLGGEGAEAGKSSPPSFHFLLWRAIELPKLKPVDAVWTSSDTIRAVNQSGAFVRHDAAYSYAPPPSKCVCQCELYGPFYFWST